MHLQVPLEDVSGHQPPHLVGIERAAAVTRSPVMCSRTSSSQVAFMALTKENLLYATLLKNLLGSEIIALLVGLI